MLVTFPCWMAQHRLFSITMALVFPLVIYQYSVIQWPMGTPGAYGAHPGTVEHSLPSRWLFPRNTSTSGHGKVYFATNGVWRVHLSLCILSLQIQWLHMCMPAGDASVLCGILIPCFFFGEVSRLSFQDEGINVKVQGFMVFLFKVNWIRSPAQCKLLNLNLFTLELPHLGKNI